nr:UDP-N-acetylmuramate--L-alanine ligase-like [Ipomoea batatas]
MGPSAVRSPLNLPARNRGGYRKPAAPVLYSQPGPSFKSNRTMGTAFASKRNGSMSAMCAQTKIQEFIEPADRKCKGWIHFVGVGGCGLSALAMLALKQGFEVSGSDIKWSSYMDPLHEAGARLYIGHSEFNLLRNDGSSLPDAVVVSSAIPVDNVEILHAKARRVPVYKRGAWLGKITEGHNLIAVSGSHGKSTTASMLAYLLHAMGDDITAVVGAKVPQADEYDYCFLGLRPHIAVVTNVDWEHVDIFQNEEEVRATFRRFVQQIRDGGHLILCGDSRGKADTEPHISNEFETFPSSELCCDRYHITTYGISSFNEWHASSIHPNSYGGSDYKLYHKGHYVADISLRMPGIHNIINSLAVIATVSIVASDKGFFDTITSLRSHLLNFRGICRRFEKVGTICGCHIYDDYAHHPTEIRAVLQAARQRFPFTELLSHSSSKE